jgi:hypothetical protein
MALCIGLASVLLLAAFPVEGDILLFDFGNDDSYRGASVSNPDDNGNYWNSVRGGAFFSNVLDIDGNVSTVDFGFTTAGGTDYFNGPSGATEDPSATVYDAGALGDLGVDEAVYDWYSSSTFQIQQLDSSATYTLTFYGSRRFPLNDTQTTYTVYTDGDFTNAIDSVTLTIGDGGAGHNQDTVAVLTGLTPQGPNDVLYVGYEGSEGGSGYLNALKVSTVVPEPSSLLLFALGGLFFGLVRRRARS